MWTLLLLGMIASTTCYPLEDLEPTQTPTTTDNTEQHENTIVNYVQNFQVVMAKLVSEKYSNLTEKDMDKIKKTLEEFLMNFAKDLKETVEQQQNNVTFAKTEEIQDGLPDATFIEIQDRMKSEFPDIKDDTAKVIVFKLRRNLYVTRQKIDNIVKSTDREFEYAES